MSTPPSILQPALQAAAALQFGVAILNLFLVRLMKWREELSRVPLLLREVFQVHAWFISVTLAIFAVLTWRFAPELASASSSLSQWLAAGIGVFWAIRTVLQVSYYSSSHWRGNPNRFIIHIILLLLYGGMALLYLGAAIPGKITPGNP